MGVRAGDGWELGQGMGGSEGRDGYRYIEREGWKG